jgi:flagellar motor protein MotB
MPTLLRTSTLLLLIAVLVPAQSALPIGSKDDWEEVNFEFNSSVLTDGFPSLLRLAELLNKNPGYKVRLDGHTDSIGSEKYNEKLSNRRCDTVKSFLEKYGTRPGQIELVPKGKRDPKTENKTKEGRWVNRRVAVTLTDEKGVQISYGGVAEAVKAMQTANARQEQTMAEILKRLDKLDEIARMIQAMKAENEALKSQIAAVSKAQTSSESALKQEIKNLPKPLNREEVTQITKDVTREVTEKTAAEAVKKNNEPRFTLMGVNAGLDRMKDLTLSGRAQLFLPFRERFALQMQGEYMYFRDRREGQVDLGLVSRVHKQFQAGLFSSFRRVDLRGLQQGGTLGQAALTLDYLFKRGRAGVFGTKSFLDNVVLDRRSVGLSQNVWEEKYLRVTDQFGASTALNVYGKTSLEANLGLLRTHSGKSKPGGMLRLTQPMNDKFALTLEGGYNETMVGVNNNLRVVAGVLFGNFMKPQEYLGFDGPVPVDVPRVRYELLTRRVRTGNDTPVADAGVDQLGVEPGPVNLDGSASHDPDGDPLTFTWDQVAGVGVGIAGRNTARASFDASEGQSYSFRLTVKDPYGAQSIARVSVTAKSSPRVSITRFTAAPATIRAGGTATLQWQVNNADEVFISGVGKVDPKAGTVPVSPAGTTIYTLTAKNAKGEVTESVQVSVEKPEVRILSFRATPANITLGEQVTLSWQAENAEFVAIDGLGQFGPTGVTTLSPLETTTYRLIASNRFGETTATATVTVKKAEAPRIASFRALNSEIALGESTTLEWQVVNATEVTITELGPQTLQGRADVKPFSTTTYIMVAKNLSGEASASVTVTVIPPAKVLSFVATPGTSGKPGDPVTLTWQTENATEVAISGIGTVAASGSMTVSPRSTTTYIITAMGKRNTDKREVTVTVKTPPPPEPPPNRTPTAAIIGGAYLFTNQREFDIDGSLSSDPDGDKLTYLWRQIGGANVAGIVNSDSPRVRVQFPTIGEYVFELMVTDPKGASSTARVTVLYSLTRP